MSQKCTRCKKVLELKMFMKKDKAMKQCNVCREKAVKRKANLSEEQKKAKREVNRLWREKNKQRVADYNKFYRENEINSKKTEKKIILLKKKNSDGEWLCFDTLIEASRTLGLNSPNIHKVLNNQMKTTGGYLVKYGIQKIEQKEKKNWKDLSKTLGYRNDCIGKPSKHRILHETKDGIVGKVCCCCDEWKSLEDYTTLRSHWDGKRNDCKECNHNYRTTDERKLAMKHYNTKYWIKTKNQQTQKHKEWKKKNKDHVNAYNRKYKRIWEKHQRATNPQFRIVKNMRCRVYNALKGNKKSQTTKELVGCSVEKLMEHLERQFNEDMSWNNYGPIWHVDHIIPCQCWDLTNPVELRACFYYKNLQPLDAFENESKGCRYNPEDKQKYLMIFLDDMIEKNI